ncbi:hypothetical protein K1719_010190 [Acacia pycnantha]|nr:hypothetical protein K1719_010190 [Acacia pycnantha]
MPPASVVMVNRVVREEPPPSVMKKAVRQSNDEMYVLFASYIDSWVFASALTLIQRPQKEKLEVFTGSGCLKYVCVDGT